MHGIGQSEHATQNRVIALFREELGYRYLGDWADRDSNSNVEEGLLSAWLTKSGYTAAQISVALHKLRTEADNHNRTLYGNNQAVYNLLRYGVPVRRGLFLFRHKEPIRLPEVDSAASAWPPPAPPRKTGHCSSPSRKAGAFFAAMAGAIPVTTGPALPRDFPQTCESPSHH